MRERAMRRAREEALGEPGGVVAIVEVDEVSDLPPPRHGSFGANGSNARVVITVEAAAAEGVELGRVGPFATEHQTVRRIEAGANLFKADCSGARVVFPARVHPARKSMEVRVVVHYSEDGHRHLDCVGASDPIPVSWRSSITKFYRLRARGTRGGSTGGIFLSHRLANDHEVSPVRASKFDSGDNPFVNLPVFDERFMNGMPPYAGSPFPVDQRGLGPPQVLGHSHHEVPRPLDILPMPGSPFLSPGRSPFELGPVPDLGGFPRSASPRLSRTPSWYDEGPMYPRHRYDEGPMYPLQQAPMPLPRQQIVELVHEVPRPEYSFVERPVAVPQVRYEEKIVEIPRVQFHEVVRPVPRVHVQEMLREVPRVVPQVVERQIEVPQVEFVERVVEVPQVHIQERFVEVPEVRFQEVVRQVPRVEVEEVERLVPRPVVQTVDRMVPVPEVQLVDRLVEVPEVHYQEVVRQVPKPVWQEAVRHVPRVETQLVEKIVEVPQVEIQEVIVPVPKVEVREIVRNVPKYQTQFVERVVEVPQMEYVTNVVQAPRFQVQQRYPVSPRQWVPHCQPASPHPRVRQPSPQPRAPSPQPLPTPLPIPFISRLPKMTQLMAPAMTPGITVQGAGDTAPRSPFATPPPSSSSFVAKPPDLPPVITANGSPLQAMRASGSFTASPPILPPSPVPVPRSFSLIAPSSGLGSFTSGVPVASLSSPNLACRPLLSGSFVAPAVSSTAPAPMVASAPSLFHVPPPSPLPAEWTPFDSFNASREASRPLLSGSFVAPANSSTAPAPMVASAPSLFYAPPPSPFDYHAPGEVFAPQGVALSGSYPEVLKAPMAIPTVTEFMPPTAAPPSALLVEKLPSPSPPSTPMLPANAVPPRQRQLPPHEASRARKKQVGTRGSTPSSQGASQNNSPSSQRQSSPLSQRGGSRPSSPKESQRSPSGSQRQNTPSRRGANATNASGKRGRWQST